MLKKIEIIFVSMFLYIISSTISYCIVLKKMSDTNETRPLYLKFKDACDSRELQKMYLNCHLMFKEIYRSKSTFIANDFDQAFGEGIQSLLQSHDSSQHLVQMLEFAKSIFLTEDLPHALDLTNYFRCCWQDGYFENCKAMLELTKTTPYHVKLSIEENKEYSKNVAVVSGLSGDV
jgi:hypothetical protein